MIVDWVNSRSISVDAALRQYLVHTPTRKPEAADSAETVVVEIETRDRGEQRQMFGHAARRFITTERRHIEYRDRPPSDITETVWEQTGDNLLEVTEFSEAALDPRLFKVPADFHRLVHPLPGESLSWIDQLIYYWQEIEDWFGHL